MQIACLRSSTSLLCRPSRCTNQYSRLKWPGWLLTHIPTVVVQEKLMVYRPIRPDIVTAQTFSGLFQPPRPPASSYNLMPHTWQMRSYRRRNDFKSRGPKIPHFSVLSTVGRALAPPDEYLPYVFTCKTLTILACKMFTIGHIAKESWH